MFEIKLCEHGHEQNKCGMCRTVFQSGFGTQWAEFACSDCNQYELRDRMIEKPDGRVICPSCDRKAQRLGIERSQLQLFGQQSLLDLPQ